MTAAVASPLRAEPGRKTAPAPVIHTTNQNNIMAISTKPFHPLDAEKNRRYKVKKKDAPKIAWHKTEETGPHDWEGYIRIPEDAEYTFTIQIDDNGYLEIDGQKVVELTGSNSSKKAEGKKTLKKGFHYAKLHHENLPVPEAIAPYPNAEEFVPKMGEADLELWEIDAPKNLMTKEEAQKLLNNYKPVGYGEGGKNTDEVWATIGGWLNQQHVNQIEGYYDSCALRVSIALSRSGTSLAGVKDEGGKLAATNITLINPPGNLGALNPDYTEGGDTSNLYKHVVLSAAVMSKYFKDKYGKPDYADIGDDGYCTPQEGDILFFGDSIHTGIAPGDILHIGTFNHQPIWLLYRATLED